MGLERIFKEGFSVLICCLIDFQNVKCDAA